MERLMRVAIESAIKAAETELMLAKECTGSTDRDIWIVHMVVSTLLSRMVQVYADVKDAAR